MPASLFDDLDHHGGGGLSMSMHHPVGGNGSSSGNTSCSVSSSSGGSLIDEDQRALQLALELSMLGLTDSSAALQLAASVAADHHNNIHSNNMLNQQMNQHHQHHHSSVLTSDLYSTAVDILPKKSQNMTECVPVPSSEHVAEIVGRQGCKIKALRAKTNTYIKTPVRGEEPVFVVTGRKEDVAAAKREILSAADHFSQIRASRKGGSGGNGPSAPAPVPGQVTIQVRVPYRVVGLVVGPKGATIKRIQQQTHTYIVTPSRDKDPVFEVTGLPDNVQVAKREIEAHIAIRTGSYPTENLGNHPMLGDGDLSNPADILASLYKSGIGALGLESLGLGGLGSLGGNGLGATINSLSSSLSSVNGLGGAMAHNHNAHLASAPGNSVGSSTSGGGSLSSLSSLNGFKVGGGGDGGFYGGHPALADLGFSLMDNNSSNNGSSNNTINNGAGQNTSTNGGFMSSSRSEDSYLFGGSGSASGSTSGPDSLGHEEGSQGKLNELFQATNSVSSSLWASFDRDEGLGDSPTLEQTTGANNLISLQ